MDKDQIKQDETVKQEPEVTELDDNTLEDASGGVADSDSELLDSNGNCLC
jgi:hypothetical protein